MTNGDNLVYAGFWIRVWASIIDTVLLVFVTSPILLFIYGKEYFDSGIVIQGAADFLLTQVFPTIAVIVFWIYKSATPGKMAISAKIVDAKSGGNPSTAQCIGRYFAYFISILPLGLGIFWVAFDKRKQGWHDKLAGTVVVRKKNGGVEPVSFTS